MCRTKLPLCGFFTIQLECLAACANISFPFTSWQVANHLGRSFGQKTASG